MSRNPAGALRALADHIDLHNLSHNDAILRAGWGDTAGEVLAAQVHAIDGDVAGALAPWVESMTDVDVTVTPSTSTDAFRLTAKGSIGGFPAEVLCLATGDAAVRIRKMAGLPVVPVSSLPSGREVLAALAGTAAAS